MKKILVFALLFFVIPFALMGCQTDGADSSDIAKVSISDSSDIAKVSISESRGFFEINTDFFVVYEDGDTTDRFEGIFKDAVKQDGIVDIASPEFDLEAELENGSKQQYHLWVGEADQSSILMYVENTNTIYLIPAADTNWLIDLLK